MKNVTRNVLLCGIVLMFALLSGCSGVSAPTKVAKGYTNPSIDGAPAWVLDPTSVPGIVAVGSAPHSPGGIQFQRNEAMAAGRDELARMLSIKVKNAFSNFAQQTGVGDAQTFDKVSSNVSKQLASETLTGSRQKDMWLAQDGTMYLMVTLDPKSVADVAKQLVQTSFKNDNARHQQNLSAKALKQLDEDIDKEFNSKAPTAVSSAQ